MKCLLVNPMYQEVYGKSEGISPITPPTGLAYIAAVLIEHSIDVKILDANAEQMELGGIQKMIKKEDPAVVGITSTTPCISKALDISRVTKEINKEIKVVLGGPHPTALPHEVVKNKYVDVVVRCEGEYTMLDLVNKIDSGEGFDNVFGITFKNNGNFIDNPSRPFIKDLDELPFPARHLLPMEKYISPQTKRKRFANILTSRGCPFKCIYCNKNIFGYKYRVRSAENIISEMEYLMNIHDIEEFHILDDIFTLSKKRVEKFCEMIKKEKMDIVWKCGNGVGVNTVNKELLKKMKDAGCYSLSFGIESGSQKILDNIRKNITLEQSRGAIKACKEVGIFTVGFFMLGNLGENEETMQQTINFAKSIDPDAAQFGILVPFPGTDIYDVIKAEGRLLTDRWEDYGNLSGQAIFEHGELTKPLMEKMYRKAYREFYMRPSYILKKLMKIRSLYDAKSYTNGLFAIVKMSRNV